VRLEARAAEGGTTLTELADHLVRDHDIPFAAAHAIAGRMLKDGRDAPATPRGALLERASIDVLGRALRYAESELELVLSARHFVEVRTTPGGPAPETTALAVQQSRQMLDVDREWLAQSRARVAGAESRLRERSRSL
jgi:argininosuccinate lyase